MTTVALRVALLSLMSLLAACTPAARGPSPDDVHSTPRRPPYVDLTWLSIANVHFQVGALGILADGYVTRLPQSAFADQTLVRSSGYFVPDTIAVARVLAALGGPSNVQTLLTGHSHFDHAFDTAVWARLTGARIIGPPTTCFQAIAQAIPASRCTPVLGGETIALGAGVTMRVVRWNHSGDPAVNPEQHNPSELVTPPHPDARTGGLRPGLAEDFPNGGGSRAYLFTMDTPTGRLSWFYQNSASPVDLERPIVVDGVSYGAPLENLRAAMRDARLDSVDLWIATGGDPIATLVLPVLKPRAYLPVHWDGLFAPFFAGVPAPFVDTALEARLASAKVRFVRPNQYMDRWRLDRTGVHAIENDSVKNVLFGARHSVVHDRDQ
jgi:L-ascorbate metabolism protein UlaG (beta-lactamase superfamily)